MMTEADVQQRYLESGMDLQVGALETVFKVLSGKERDEGVKKLREGLAKYIRQEQKYKDQAKAVEQVRLRANEVSARREYDGADVDKWLEEAERDYATHMGEVEMAKHPLTKLFEQKVRELSGEAGSTQTQDMGDEDLIQTQGEVNTMCPVSKRPMTDPVKNSKCGHVYDRDSIMGLLSQTSRTKCPIPGCANREFVKGEHLEVDYEMKRHVKARRGRN